MSHLNHRLSPWNHKCDFGDWGRRVLFYIYFILFLLIWNFIQKLKFCPNCQHLLGGYVILVNPFVNGMTSKLKRNSTQGSYLFHRHNSLLRSKILRCRTIPKPTCVFLKGSRGQPQKENFSGPKKKHPFFLQKESERGKRDKKDMLASRERNPLNSISYVQISGKTSDKLNPWDLSSVPTALVSRQKLDIHR